MELDKNAFIGRIVESVVVGEAHNIREIMKLLNGLDMLASPASPCLDDDRVQGGERTPAALRRVEIEEKIARHNPWVVQVACAFRNVRDRKLTAYVYSLLEGLEGAAIMKRAQIGKAQRRKYQGFLVALLGYEGVGRSNR